MGLFNHSGNRSLKLTLKDSVYKTSKYKNVENIPESTVNACRIDDADQRAIMNNLLSTSVAVNTAQNSVLCNLQVSNLPELMPDVINYFKLKTESFKAGQISLKLTESQKIISDTEVLCTVAGEKIEFTSLPQQNSYKTNKFSEKENSIIAEEIQQLLAKEVIVESKHEPDEFISPIFLRPKPDGSHRLILNLKKLNENVVYRHFKMDSILTAINLMKPNCYMASIDLKDAYYSVRVSPKHQKYLKFLEWYDV